ncbi:lactamase [Geobacillus sp. A8]|uniref:MBL fold metallo-hydrolase n=1 Tax=Geobacillus sp. A8 TaxID=1095383 RepID=UPI00038A4EF8|nr:MBL fold metallo-hydrolase [Geobacillus sp. A8]EQB94916.1 lactamase [Geobacillus sp. A8]
MTQIEMEWIGDEMYRVPIPVPFPMKYVYCYVGRETDGWSIVDVGFRYPEAISAWEAVFRQLGIKPRHVQAIYITHFHPDHFGLAGWMQQQTEAPVWISEPDYAMAERVWGEESVQASEVGAMFRRHGVPDELVTDIEESMWKLSLRVSPFPVLTVLDRSEIVLGQRRWAVIPVPGHSDGLISFYQPESRQLLASDHVLDRITPNISVWPGAYPNPLEQYFASLRKVEELEVDVALPAHGAVIRQFRERISDIFRHHEQRLQKMKTLATSGRTAYEVAHLVFGHKPLTVHQWRFAVAETLAHLEYLVSVGELQKEEHRHAIVYRQ